MASRKAKGTKKRAQRAHSNVFAMFDQDQIAEFKEAFNFVDQNRDGFIDKGLLNLRNVFHFTQFSKKSCQITIFMWILCTIYEANRR